MSLKAKKKNEKNTNQFIFSDNSRNRSSF